MSEKRKKYFAEIFFKKTQQKAVIKKYIEQCISLCYANYPSLDEDEFNNIKEKYNIDVYMNQAIEKIASYFTEDELKEVVNFVSSSVGQKLYSFNFIMLNESLINDFIGSIDNEMSKKNKKNGN